MRDETKKTLKVLFRLSPDAICADLLKPGPILCTFTVSYVRYDGWESFQKTSVLVTPEDVVSALEQHPVLAWRAVKARWKEIQVGRTA